MANETRRRLERLEKTNPAGVDEVTEIRRVMIEPSADGPRESGDVWVVRRQPDGTFPTERERES